MCCFDFYHHILAITFENIYKYLWQPCSDNKYLLTFLISFQVSSLYKEHHNTQLKHSLWWCPDICKSMDEVRRGWQAIANEWWHKNLGNSVLRDLTLWSQVSVFDVDSQTTEVAMLFHALFRGYVWDFCSHALLRARSSAFTRSYSKICVLSVIPLNLSGKALLSDSLDWKGMLLHNSQ